jgi:phospholipid/cholesterol/gamma-HCH transport system substrate-binding protein
VSSQRSIEIRAGIFLFLCLAIGAGLVWKFGKLSGTTGERYPVFVMFDNVGGLIPKANVMYAGIEVGKVETIDLVEDGKLRAKVTLGIYDRYAGKIRSDAHFVINQSGLLGDRYVDIIPGSITAPVLTANAVVEGSPSVDLTEAIRSVTEVLRQAGSTISRVDAILARTDAALTRVDQIVLSTQNLQHVTATFANVEQTSSNAVVLSQNLREILTEARASITNTLRTLATSADTLQATFQRADGVVKDVGGVVQRVDGVVKDVGGVVQRVDGVVKDVGGVVQRVDGVVKEAEPEIRTTIKNIADSTQRLNTILNRLEKGDGTVGKLLTDPTLHDEVVRLVRNLRQHGLLYREGSRSSTSDTAAPPRGKTPVPARPATGKETKP